MKILFRPKMVTSPAAIVLLLSLMLKGTISAPPLKNTEKLFYCCDLSCHDELGIQSNCDDTLLFETPGQCITEAKAGNLGNVVRGDRAVDLGAPTIESECINSNAEDLNINIKNTDNYRPQWQCCNEGCANCEDITFETLKSGDPWEECTDRFNFPFAHNYYTHFCRDTRIMMPCYSDFMNCNSKMGGGQEYQIEVCAERLNGYYICNEPRYKFSITTGTRLLLNNQNFYCCDGPCDVSIRPDGNRDGHYCKVSFGDPVHSLISGCASSYSHVYDYLTEECLETSIAEPVGRKQWQCCIDSACGQCEAAIDPINYPDISNLKTTFDTCDENVFSFEFNIYTEECREKSDHPITSCCNDPDDCTDCAGPSTKLTCEAQGGTPYCNAASPGNNPYTIDGYLESSNTFQSEPFTNEPYNNVYDDDDAVAVFQVTRGILPKETTVSCGISCNEEPQNPPRTFLRFQTTTERITATNNEYDAGGSCPSEIFTTLGEASPLLILAFSLDGNVPLTNAQVTCSVRFPPPTTYKCCYDSDCQRCAPTEVFDPDICDSYEAYYDPTNLGAECTPTPPVPAPVPISSPIPAPVPTSGVGDPELPVSKTGGAFDDPHFKTFGGEWYDFMGECSLVLISASEPGFVLNIHIQTKARFDYSYIRNAAVSINNDTLEVASFGEYYLNSASNADLDTETLAGFQVMHFHPSKNIHIFEIQLAAGESIIIKTYKDMVSVKLDNADPKRFLASMGMMGQYESGKLLGRDGRTELSVKTETDAMAFAREWQVRPEEPMLFYSINGPQYPEECIMPSKEKKVKTETLRGSLGQVSLEAAKRACANLKENVIGCIHDVMMTGDVGLAQSSILR